MIDTAITTYPTNTQNCRARRLACPSRSQSPPRETTTPLEAELTAMRASEVLERVTSELAELLRLLPQASGRPQPYRDTAPVTLREHRSDVTLPLPAGPPLDEPAAGPLAGPITESERRVLRYLPTNLSAPEIARELSVSVSTIRTHMRHLFAKLDVHRRTEAVTRARALGLLTAVRAG
jgi:LuxR family transcriptional regulator, maltose regulon positive regulatory protein